MNQKGASLQNDLVDELNSAITIEDVENMDSSATSLMVAVSKAAGRPLHPDVTDDMVTMQIGCDVLNHWGYGPRFRYTKCFYCPHSLDLGDAFISAGVIDGEAVKTHVSDDDVKSLSEILSRGREFSIAYTAMLVALDYNPGLENKSLKKIVAMVYPEVSAELDVMVSSLPM